MVLLKGKGHFVSLAMGHERQISVSGFLTQYFKHEMCLNLFKYACPI